MEKRGHIVKVTASEKEVTYELLEYYGLNYLAIGNYGKNLVHKALNIPWLDIKMHKAVKDFSPDIFVGIGSIRAAHVSKLLGKPCIIFEDTEHCVEQCILYKPFADAILTPSSFKKDLGRKHIKYDGCHELAYLHPHYFDPDISVLDELGLSAKDAFFVLRFAAFNASHDLHSTGFRYDYIQNLLDILEKEGRIFITSERKLDPILERFRVKISPEKYQNLLYHASMYIGEGSTSAEEAAIMGVPALHFERMWKNGKPLSMTSVIGYLDELQNKYGLLYSFCYESELLDKLDYLLSNFNSLKKEWIIKKERFLNDKIDVTKFMIWLIENYPESIRKMQDDTYRFEF